MSRRSPPASPWPAWHWWSLADSRPASSAFEHRSDRRVRTEASDDGSADFVDFREAEPGSGEGIKLGYISLGDSVPFVKLVSDSIKREAEIAGAELVFCDSQSTARGPRLRPQLRHAGRAGVPELPASPTPPQSICEAGPQVPVIAIDIVQGDCQTSFMGADNATPATSPARPSASTPRTRGTASTTRTSRSRTSVSATPTACAWAARGGLRVDVLRDPGRASARRRTQDTARTKFADTLTSLPDTHKIIVVAINDDGLIGALAAARTAGRAEHLPRRPGRRPDVALRDPEQSELDRRRRLLPGALRRDRHCRTSSTLPRVRRSPRSSWSRTSPSTRTTSRRTTRRRGVLSREPHVVDATARCESRVRKSFGGVEVLHGVDLDATGGECWRSSARTAPASRRWSRSSRRLPARRRHDQRGRPEPRPAHARSPRASSASA